MYLLVMILVYSGFIGLVMELYKKIVRKNLAKILEIRILAFLLSAFFGFLVYKIVPVNIAFEGIKNTPYIIIFYTVLIYLLQLPSCMKIWKPMLKDVIERKIK